MRFKDAPIKITTNVIKNPIKKPNPFSEATIYNEIINFNDVLFWFWFSAKR